MTANRGAPPRFQYRTLAAFVRHRSFAGAILSFPGAALGSIHARLSRCLAGHAVAAVLAMAGAPATLIPSATAGAQVRWFPQLRLDNDAYNFWVHPAYRPDEEYTNGVRATLVANAAPWWGRRFAPETPDCGGEIGSHRCRFTAISLGQDIYTPRLDRTPFSVPDWERERPYFGWLYLEEKAFVASDRWLHTTTATLGVTGPPSLGHVMQALFHQINRKYTREANGWETQVGFEPGLILGHRVDALALRAGSREARAFDLTTGAGIVVGNVRTAADVGATMRLGANLNHPWRPWVPAAHRLWDAFLLAGGRLEYVARDMSLDGTLLRSGRHVDRVPTVREYQFGAGVRVLRLQLEYRAVTRTQEYLTGPGHHTYSTMSASLTAPR